MSKFKVFLAILIYLFAKNSFRSLKIKNGNSTGERYFAIEELRTKVLLDVEIYCWNQKMSTGSIFYNGYIESKRIFLNTLTFTTTKAIWMRFLI